MLRSTSTTPISDWCPAAGRHDDDGWIHQGKDQGDPPDKTTGQDVGWSSYTEEDNTGERGLHVYGIWNQFPRPGLWMEAPVDGTYSFDGTVKIDWGVEPGAPPHDNDPEICNDGTNCYGYIYNLYHIPANAGGVGQAWADNPGNDKQLIQVHEPKDATGTINVDLGSIAAAQDLAVSAGDFLGLRIGHIGLVGQAGFAEVYGLADACLNCVSGDPAKIVGPVPEPATLAALGLGCLPALLRRRR